MSSAVKKNNPTVKHTLSEFVDAGKASTKIDYYTTSILDGEVIHYSIDNVIRDYIDELLAVAVPVELDTFQHSYYEYDGVYMLSYDLYGTRDYSYILMLINGVYDTKDFTMNPIKLIRKDILNNLLSQIYNAEKGFIKMNRAKMGIK